MSLWTYNTPPSWTNPGGKLAVATPAGWADPDTGELLVAIGGLNTIFEPNGAPNLAHVYFNQLTYKRGSIAYVIANYSEPVVVTGTPQVTINVNGSPETASYATPSGATATAAYVAGIEYQVMTITVTGGGTNYFVPPVVTLSGGAGTYTSAVATVVAGAVTAVTVTGALGYTGNPTVSFTPAASSFVLFAYTVQTTDAATPGQLTISSPINLNGGTIKGTTNTVLTLTGITGTFLAASVQATATAVGSGSTVTVTVANGGSGYFSGAPTVTLAGGGGTYSSATATVSNGVVTAVSVSGAAGYTSNPSVALTAPPLSMTTNVVGETSAATGTVKFWDITNSLLHLVNVGGVGSPPTPFTTEVVTVVGSGATAGTPVLSKVGDTSAFVGSILSIPVTAGGTGYAIPPVVTITDGSGSGASAYAVLSTTGFVEAIVVEAAGSGYVSPSVALTVQGYATISVVSAPTTALSFTSDPSVALTQMSGVLPTISSIAIPIGSYVTNQSLPITVTFSKAIAVQGVPTMTLNFAASSTTGTAVCDVDSTGFFAGADGLSTTLVYNYTVQVADKANFSGVTISSPLLTPSGSTIQDVTGNPATLTHSETFPFVGVNDVGGVESISLANSVTTGTLDFQTGDVMSFSVLFDQIAVVGGSPELPININSSPVNATYSSGSGSNTLVFAYTVQTGDAAAQSQLTTGTALTLNGGTIKDVAGSASILTFTQASFATATVNTPMVLSVSGAPVAGNHVTGEVETLTATFNENVTVVGAPYIAVQIGSNPRHFAYAAGTGTKSLSFTYTLVSGDAATATNYTVGAAITLNSGTIQNANANNAVLSYTAPNTALVVVNDVAATISTPAIAAGNYVTAATLPVTVTYGKAVTVTGVPTLAFTTTGGSQVATYASGSGTTTLTFNYTVQSTDTIGAVSSAATSLTLNGGTITDSLGVAASNTFSAAGTFAGVATNDVLATLGTPVDTNATSLTYPAFSVGTNDVLTVTFTASKAVTVTGSPYLVVNTAGGARHAVYSSGTGTTTLAFGYQVVTGDIGIAGTVGVGGGSIITLGGGTMKDALGIPITLTFTAPNSSAISITA